MQLGEKNMWVNWVKSSSWGHQSNAWATRLGSTHRIHSYWDAPLKEPRGWWKYGWSMVEVCLILVDSCLYFVYSDLLVVHVWWFKSFVSHPSRPVTQGWFVNVLSGEQSPISGMVGWHSRHSHGEDSQWLDDVERRQPWLIKTSGFVDLIQFD